MLSAYEFRDKTMYSGVNFYIVGCNSGGFCGKITETEKLDNFARKKNS